MNLCEYDQWSQGEEAAIGFLRHSEIKHGRIAMFGFVGYIVQSNGIHWPWNIESSGLSFGDLSAAGSPPEQWDALSTAAKIQVGPTHPASPLPPPPSLCSTPSTPAWRSGPLTLSPPRASLTPPHHSSATLPPHAP